MATQRQITSTAANNCSRELIHPQNKIKTATRSLMSKADTKSNDDYLCIGLPGDGNPLIVCLIENRLIVSVRLFSSMHNNEINALMFIFYV